MKKILSFLIFSITLSSLGQAISVEKIKINKAKIALIEYDKNWGFPFKNAEPAQLNDTDFKEIERLLIECTSKSNELLPLKKYYRQYVVVKNKNGEKEVYINCMCELVSLDFADWKKELIDIADGEIAFLM
jgi:aminopeptidase-like protein